MTTARPLGDHETSDGRHVLVADDEPIMREILGSLLSEAGYTVVLAASGREAITLASNQMAIAFIDLAMPDGNGLELCSALREMPNWHDVPIIVLTHYSLDQALNTALRAGASGFLCKPLVPAELFWCLEVHINEKINKDRPSSPTIWGLDSWLGVDSVNIPDDPMRPLGCERTLHISQAGLERRADAFANFSPDSIIAAYRRPEPVSGADASTRFGPEGHLNNVAVPSRAGQSASADLASDMDTLHRVATFFDPSVMARMLGQLVASIEEILLALEARPIVAKSDELACRLHNLAGTAGTLGFGLLSAAARDLEYGLSISARTLFTATAQVTLRVINEYIADQSDGSAALPQTGSLHVLVVDDQAISRELAHAFLSTAGHKVTCAESGAEAIARVATTDFQVILMDVRMPGMDGLETTRRIRELDGSRGRVPIIGLSARTFADQIAECYTTGMDAHLAKPFSPETLLSAVCMQFRRDTKMSE